MSFEDIPEDKKESYPCPNCEGGNVSPNENNILWECDICDFEYPVMHESGGK